MKSQSNRYGCAENPAVIYDVPLQDVTVVVWCATSASRITGPILFLQDPKFTLLHERHSDRSS